MKTDLEICKSCYHLPGGTTTPPFQPGARVPCRALVVARLFEEAKQVLANQETGFEKMPVDIRPGEDVPTGCERLFEYAVREGASRA